MNSTLSTTNLGAHNFSHLTVSEFGGSAFIFVYSLGKKAFALWSKVTHSCVTEIHNMI